MQQKVCKVRMHLFTSIKTNYTYLSHFQRITEDAISHSEMASSVMRNGIFHNTKDAILKSC